MVDTGRAALAALTAGTGTGAGTGTFDIVLMDMQMPEMDGSEATRALRALPPPLGRIPVLALTADVLPEHRERFLAAGVDDLVPKPIDWNVLAAALEVHAPRGGAAAGTAEAVKATVIPAPPSAPLPPPPIAALPGIDMALAMRRSDGQRELFWSLLTDFVADYPGEADRIERAVRDGDLATARLYAHSLRGAAGNLGATRLAAAAAVIERAVKTETADGLEGAFDELRQSLAEVVEGARGKIPAGG